MSAPRNLVSLERDGHVAVVRLSRPEALNAISSAMAEELEMSFKLVSADDDVWVMVLAAAGDRAFCVGADLKERASFTLEQFHENRKRVKGMFAALRSVPQPTVASVFGYALGGGFELALSCDLIVASEDCEFGLPEARVGLLPAGGGTQLLARKVGLARAKECIFTGERFGVEEAFEMGLLYDAAPQEGLVEATADLAETICGCSPVALREAKRSIDAGLGVPLEEGIEIENGAWARVIASEDRAEGIAAFNEKRAPEWKNR